MLTRPVVHCLVAYVTKTGVPMANPKRVPLEATPDYLALGFVAIGPDPQDMADLATWERACARPRP